MPYIIVYRRKLGVVLYVVTGCEVRDMEGILEINRMFSEFKTMFKEEDVELTFNEALVLIILKKEGYILKEIEKKLVRDRAYICRIVKGLMMRGYISKDRNIYKLTEQGVKEAEMAHSLFKDIVEELEAEMLIAV